MLGITTPDAIALGMMILAGLAAWNGSRAGQVAKNNSVSNASMVAIGGGILAAEQFGDWIKCVDKMSIALTRHADAMDRQHDVKHTNALERLAEKVDDALNANPKRNHR